MFRNLQKRVIAIILVVLHILIMPVGKSYAAAPTVELVANPDTIEVYAGSEPVALFARASGTNLQFKWELLGPGKIEGEGSAIFYSIPDNVDKKSQAIITVIVSDEKKQEATAAYTFTILPVQDSKSVIPAPPSPPPAKQPPAKPVEAPPAKKGMSTGTKVAIGVGAAALLGGAVMLLAGGDDDSEPSLSGSWAGALIINGGMVDISLTLSQRGNNVTGYGSMGRISFHSVTGMNMYPNVTLTMEAQGFFPAYFQGRFADKNTIPGTLSGSGFENDPLTLRRR